MELRRFTMTNPTAIFSLLAHEARDHKFSEGENHDDGSLDNGHNASQKSRRRSRVSDSISVIIRYYTCFYNIIISYNYFWC
jgi:hypothetical protein